MPEWTIRPATLADRDDAIALMDRAFGPLPIRAPLWDWAFERNPLTDELFYLVADTGTVLAGQYAALPVAIQHDGKVLRGLVSMFTATDPAFQRQGVFYTLASKLYEQSSDTCPVVFGFPNHRSAPGLYGRLGWVDLRPYPHLRRPLRNLGRYPRGNVATHLAAGAFDLLDRVGGDADVSVVPVENFDVTGDLLWSRMAPDAGTAIVRDARFLNWRFVDSPFRYIRLVALVDGSPAGLAVLAAEPRHGKARLMELMVPREEPAAVARALLRRVIELATDSGAYGLGCIATPRHPHRRALLSAGLLPIIPRPLGRSPVDGVTSSFGVRVNGTAVNASKMLHIDDWYLSSADQDWL